MRPTVLMVSMRRLVDNAKALRARLLDGVKLMCVIKADAYGHGALNTARALEPFADMFAVATVEEAIALREDDILKTILVLGGACEDALKAAVQWNVSQAVYDTDALKALEQAARALGFRARAHIKIDTGMARIGVQSEEALAELLECWRDCPNVELEGIFTHFCAVDSDVEFTRQQDANFMRAVAQVRAAGYAPIVHAAASSAMLMPEYQHDMVRAGIALYGSCMPALAGELQNAQRLVTKPIRIGSVRKGETVGYGRTFTADRDRVIMTLPIGYGDGYPRILGNRAEVLVHGKRARIVGRVCMDMIMVDITDIPGVTKDDEVVLMGNQGAENITPEELAQLADTIPYEIMLGFLPRVPRVLADF